MIKLGRVTLKTLDPKTGEEKQLGTFDGVTVVNKMDPVEVGSETLMTGLNATWSCNCKRCGYIAQGKSLKGMYAWLTLHLWLTHPEAKIKLFTTLYGIWKLML